MKYRKLIIAGIVLLFCNYLQAQQAVEHGGTFDRVSGSLLYVYQTEEIHGSPFLSDKWMNADITMNNGYTFKGISMKMDAYRNKLIFNRNDSSYELNTDAVTTVKFFPSSTDTAQAILLKKGFSINGSINSGKYVQVIAEGKITLLKNYGKNMEEFTEYGNAVKQKRFNDIQQYYIYKDGRYTNISLSRKSMETVLQEKWAQVEPFIKQNNISGKDEKGWAAAINFYNGL